MELELTTLVAPVPVPQAQKETEQKQEAKPTKAEQNVDVRKELIADVTRTELVPKEVSAKASDVPPVRRGVTTVVGTSDSNAAAPMPAGPGAGTVVGAPTKVQIADEPPPPEAKPTPPRCSHFRWRAQRKSDQLTQAGVSTDCQSRTCFRHCGSAGAD